MSNVLIRSEPLIGNPFLKVKGRAAVIIIITNEYCTLVAVVISCHVPLTTTESE